jgi:hypothetical protein
MRQESTIASWGEVKSEIHPYKLGKERTIGILVEIESGGLAGTGRRVRPNPIAALPEQVRAGVEEGGQI